VSGTVSFFLSFSFTYAASGKASITDAEVAHIHHLKIEKNNIVCNRIKHRKKMFPKKHIRRFTTGDMNKTCRITVVVNRWARAAWNI